MADPNLPQPESYEQINSDLISSYASKLGINDTQVGSLVTGFLKS